MGLINPGYVLIAHFFFPTRRLIIIILFEVSVIFSLCERNVCEMWLRDELKKWSSHFLDNLSDCLVFAPQKYQAPSAGFEPMTSAIASQRSWVWILLKTTEIFQVHIIMRRLLKLSVKCEDPFYRLIAFHKRFCQGRSHGACRCTSISVARTFVTYVSINIHQLFAGRITHLLFRRYLNWFQSAYTWDSGYGANSHLHIWTQGGQLS